MTGSMKRRAGGSYEKRGGKEKLLSRTKDGNAPRPDVAEAAPTETVEKTAQKSDQKSGANTKEK